MTKIIFSLVLLAGVSASAAQVPAFKCTVEGKTPTVVINVSVSKDESIDFVQVDVNDKGLSTLFMQMEKGAFEAGVTAGSVTTLVLGEQFSQGDDGVIRDAGIMALGLEKGAWGGLLSAKGNIYPLSCTKL